MDSKPTISPYSWTGDADSVTIWGERMAPVGELAPTTEFRLFGWTWVVERQARRTTFARGVSRDWTGCRIQLKKSKLVDISHTVTR